MTVLIAPLLLSATLALEPLPFTDGMDTIRNPGCGVARGDWAKTSPGMSVGGVNLCSSDANCTKLWRLEKFSKGYLYSTNGVPLYDHYAHITNGFVGGVDIPLDANTLLSISNSLAACRRNGGTCIPRFAYTDDKWCGSEPDDFQTILLHIRQLGEVVRCFGDVVPAVECGMIGPWGEMHSSRYAESPYAKQVTSAWLDVLPEGMPLLVRASRYIIYETGAHRRRMGLFNDGYLGNDHDYGTWDNGADCWSRSQGRAELRARNFPYGGEFATVTSEYFDSHTTLLDPTKYNIVEEWYDTRLSYLRNLLSSSNTPRAKLASTTFDHELWSFDNAPSLVEYDGQTLAKFCEDHMGYRFVVRGVDVRRTGRRVTLGLTIENTGFGRLLFPETKEVLVSRGGAFAAVAASGTDLRLLECGATSLAEVAFELPSSMPLGEYSVSLRVRAPLADESGAELPRRAIAFANDGCYNATTKANYICKVNIDGSSDGQSGAADYSGGGTVVVPAGSTNDLSSVVFSSGAALTVSGGGTVVLGGSMPSAIDVASGTLVLTAQAGDIDFSSINPHKSGVVLLNRGSAAASVVLGSVPEYVRLEGEWSQMVPASTTHRVAVPTEYVSGTIDVYGTLDVRADLTLSGDAKVVVHSGGVFGNLKSSTQSGKAKIVVVDLASIVLDGGTLLNPVNGNWSGSGLCLDTEVEGAKSLVLRNGATVTLFRSQGQGKAVISVEGNATWNVWYEEWYGNGRAQVPFLGAREVDVAEGATLSMTRVRMTGWSDQQDGKDITVRLAEIPIAGRGSLCISNNYTSKSVVYEIGGGVALEGGVTVADNVNAQLRMTNPWWFAYFSGPNAGSGGEWSGVPGGEGAFSIDEARARGCDVSIEIQMRAGWAAALPETAAGDPAGFAFLQGEGGELVPYGFADGEWLRLEGRVPRDLEEFTLGIDLVRDADTCIWTVTYTVNGEPLAHEGAVKLQIGRVADPVSLIFSGEGQFGAFSARQIRRTQHGIKVILR